MSTIRVAAIAGSLRQRSFHRALIENSKRLAPEGMEIDHILLDDVPLYNTDLEQEFPQVVTALKDRVKQADGVLFAVPEHNYSFSGVLKNAVDWMSRPYGDSAFDGKPVILQSASSGWAGGLRAQAQFRQVLGYFGMRQMFFPEVFVGSASDKFDQDLNLCDEKSTELIRKQLAAFADFIRGV